MPDKSMEQELKRVIRKYGYEPVVDDGLFVMRAAVGHPHGDFYMVRFRPR